MAIKIKEAVYCYLFTTIVIAVQFVFYLLDSQILSVMDAGGWLFYLTSCISHAACIAIIPFLIQLLFRVIRLSAIGNVLSALSAIILSFIILINEQVYQLYRFHINGFVLNMLTGPAADEIFTFDTALYAKVALFFVIVGGLYAAGWWFCIKGKDRWPLVKGKRIITYAMSLIVICTLFAHAYHIYANFYEKPSVIACRKLLPYYFPTTSNSLLRNTFHLEAPEHADTDLGSGFKGINYPLHPLEIEKTDSIRPNILLILVDSWNSRTLTEECMPNTYKYAQNNSWFQNHFSCSNGTRSAVFGLWYSISSYYWDIAEANHITPAILDATRENGYSFHNYPSASQLSPPFGHVIFGKENNVRVSTPGNTALERDTQITKDFIEDIKTEGKLKEPFISFLFYDLPHSYELPEEKTNTFTPSWKYADFTKLNNSIDPTPFWNLYRNICFETDKLLAEVLTALDETGLSDNTIVILTGDHSQEFNENKKNYWGHNGNFSKHQIGVPMIMHIPHQESAVYTHRTTHYDIVPTLMQEALGVTNPISDYSMGHLLTDQQSRNWHIVGSDLNYAFIIEGDTILEKTAEGSLNVYDANMNLVPDYKLNAKDFKNATMMLNSFME